MLKERIVKMNSLRVSKTKRKTVLIDLDDTLVSYNGYKGWRHIGKLRDFAIEFVKAFKDYNWIVILWTSRSETRYIMEWAKDNGFVDDDGNLLFDYVNSNPENAIIGCNPAKPLCDLIIDDKMWPLCGKEVPLKKIYEDLFKRGILQKGIQEP